jgi:transcriptional regulator with XRE-family HTH domain
MYLSENLKKLRKEKNMRQEDVAEVLNMHRSNYAKIEKGDREITVASLVILSKFYDVSIDDLILSSDVTRREIIVSDSSALEHAHLLEQIKKEDREIVYRIMQLILNTQRHKRNKNT